MPQKTVDYERVFLVHGLKRSGNHAIMNWIAAQGRFRVVNNVIPKAPILEGNPVPPPLPFREWVKINAPQSPVETLLRRLLGRKRSLIVSLEDHPLSVTPFTDVPVTLVHILIIRDPENLFASRIRKAAHVNNPAYSAIFDERLEEVIGLWKAHAREFLGKTNLLHYGIGIYYPHWYRSGAHRERIAEALGLRFTDAGFQNVSSLGGGSSFDGTSFDAKSTGMNVLNRASELNGQERELLQTILKDPELLSLSAELEKSTTKTAVTP